VNDNPEAVNDSATTDEDNPVTVDVVANDTDVDGDTRTLQSVGTAANGSVTIVTGQAQYSPSANFHGTDSFTYVVSDGHGGTATGTVNITVNSVNDNPGAVNDSATTDEDNPVTVDVVANDTDVDGDTRTLQSVGTAANGSITIVAGQAQYSPNANFHGTDSFTYVVSDGHGGTATGTVNITVNSVNDNPEAVNDSGSTNEDNAVIVDVVANDTDVDGDTRTLQSVGTASHGSVVIDSGKAKYSPNSNYYGPDSFTYVVSDGHGGTATGNVSITVNPVNDNPEAVNDSASTNEDNSVAVDVVANDSDVDGDSKTLQSVGSAAHGSVTIVAGQAQYSPNPNYNGPDSFTYVVADGHGGTANGSVSVSVNAVNDAPSANGQSVVTASNTPIAIILTGSDVETAPANFIFTITSGPLHGSLMGTGDNRTYSPAPNYSGPDSFKFTITDTGDGTSPALTSTEATVTIIVNDTVAPTITLKGVVISLSPPNHNYRTINVSDLVASASDNFDMSVNLSKVVISKVTSDEQENGNGSGNTINDIVIASNCKSVQLRSERQEGADGRVYTITFSVTDQAGNTGTKTATVFVPVSGQSAIDSGVKYTVNGNCQ
jgi:serine/threonine protein phosphatase PrpC